MDNTQGGVGIQTAASRFDFLGRVVAILALVIPTDFPQGEEEE
jgi:hypothetical protein